MIGSIRGKLVHKRPPEILVDVGGVGYEIQVPMSTLFQLPQPGGDVHLVTHLVVREDAQVLFGFYDERDRELFRLLIRVSNVGPKLALAILSGMDASAFAHCIQREDIGTLVALPGVGRKTAERLVMEMRDKLDAWLQPAGGAAVAGANAAPAASSMVADAESALISLGYKPAEAAKAVAAVNDDAVADSEELIRRALKSMVSA